MLFDFGAFFLKLQIMLDEDNYSKVRNICHHFTTFHAPKGIKIQTTPNFLYD